MSQHTQLECSSSDDGTTRKPDFDSVRAVVAAINEQMHAVLDDFPDVKLRCMSRLKITESQEFFEFSDHSVLSNLYWGIDNAEAAALEVDSGEERKTRLENAERMLQVPASLDENGATLGIPNEFLICCAYFHLAMVEMVRGNEWQVAMHFLQAILVSPGDVCAELAPGVCRRLLGLGVFRRVGNGAAEMGSGGEGAVEDVMRGIAGRYKPWLMYYQIMSGGGGVPVADIRVQRSLSKESDVSCEDRTVLGTYHNEGNDQDNIKNEESVTRRKMVPYSEKSCFSRQTTGGSSSIKCLRDILTESDPDSPISIYSDRSSSADGVYDFEEDSVRIGENHAEALTQYTSPSWNSHISCFKPKPEKTVSLLLQKQVNETKCISHSLSTSFCTKNKSASSHIKSEQRVPLDMIKRSEENLITEQSGILDRIISKLCFTDDLEHYRVEMNTIYEMLNAKTGLKYSLLKEMILDHLLISITTSKDERVVRTSVAILSTIVTENRTAIEELKKKGLQLHDLAMALKRKVHEAVILIYLINPSPVEIKTLGLLPCLVEVVCSYKVKITPPMLTPPAASLMIIEVLVSAFDGETNSMHLAAISSPKVLSSLLQVPRKDSLDEFVSLAAVLVKCMRFDGKCRKYIAEFSPVGPFVALLWSNQKRAASVALEFFNELMRMPRTSAIGLLEQIQKQGSMDNMCALFLLTQDSEPEYRLLAANLLLQLEALEDTSSKSIYREEAVEALLEPLTRQDSPATQSLSAFLLSNLGGTYSWTGEPYTMPCLVKKTGLTLAEHRNLIKNYNFLDQSLQDAVIDPWCSKIAQRILHIGSPVFHAFKQGLNSKFRRVARDCLIAAAWLGCELVKGPDELRNEACEIMLYSIEQFVHPGFELEERLLACLCIYNYTSGRGMTKIVNLSEGVRESLRRLSNVTWMAEELLKVADYFQPNKWRISCVHSQILEVGNKSNGAVTALIYYKGMLHGGYLDGSIKVWDIKGQTATLVQEMKEHRKAVTCFALYEPGNCLLSGSADKTIKIWHMLQRNRECIEVIQMKDPVRNIKSWGELIFATTQSHKLKVIDASRKVNDVFKNKRVKCVRLVHGKVYAGCTDSSIQELMITNNRQLEIKAPSKSWMQHKPITSVAVYKDWLYSASSVLEGSKIKDWRRSNKPQISMMPEKRASILAMEVVEDFVYLNYSTAMHSLQIWLRGTQHKVGRLSAGSKITSLLSANDMILCGTEKGEIKGWIPL